jgi:hypothetical protein
MLLDGKPNMFCSKSVNFDFICSPFSFFTYKLRALCLQSNLHFFTYHKLTYMDIMQLLKDQVSGQVMEQLSQRIGGQPEQTAQAANGIFASILGGLANNAATPQGLQGLMGALDRDHDGSIIDDLMGLVSGSAQVQNPSAVNGMGILGHVLGGNQENVAQKVSQSSGLDMQQVMKLMPILAPIVMGMLGKMRNQGAQAGAANNGFGMDDLAGILMGSAQSASRQPGMGDILGSVLGQVLSGQQQQPQASGGLFGKILGGLFRK